MAKRGQLTRAIVAQSLVLLGKEISQAELRLMPYVQYCMVNDQAIQPSKINADERAILSDWRQRGWIEGGAAGMTMTEHFWKAIHDLIWVAYVIHESQPDE